MSLLSDKIANQRLTMDAQNKVHSLDEFRSTVNYVNTTNKGYVRFTTKGGNGGLAIEKFNNVIDMPLSWRTNVSSSHNRAIRQALERSLNPYLEYLDADKKGKLLDIVKNLIQKLMATSTMASLTCTARRLRWTPRRTASSFRSMRFSRTSTPTRSWR